ncbi:FecR domain-containing protein [uncultured Parabacteroides sp.]|uniref:FecR family protein n=1 Tax=uncultured Parabacteroides sp. TaxID=512312 RepID=UPI0025D0D793|nr:FecR domain-containing protein [uncultured Parabacteroides sp.]
MNTEEKHIENLLLDYFAGELSETEEKELLLWLEADEANKGKFSEMADWWAIARVPLFKSNMKADFRDHFGNLTGKTLPIKENRFFNWRIWGKVAASVLLVVAISTTSYYAGKSDRKPEKEQIAWFETVTPAGSQSKVVLPDHSVVWVNAGSSLKYNMDFTKQNREVLLTGEAYFEVAKDSLRPFVVKLGKLDIRVLGTSFNVKAYDNEETIDVALVCGKVNVHLADDDKEEKDKDIVLVPNRMISYNKETSQVKMSKVDGASIYAWTNGRIEFDEQPFDRIARDLERKFNVQIRINSKSLHKEIFSGSFSTDQTLDYILREVDVEKKYTWKQVGNEFIIEDK